MELSINAILLLRHVLSYTGDKQVGPKGEEVPAPRTINGMESSQRRQFTKNTENAVNEYNTKSEDIHNRFSEFRKSEKTKTELENPKLAGETDENYQERIEKLLAINENIKSKFTELQKELVDSGKKVYTVEITEKTLNVAKKYFNEFGEKTGYTAGDDDIVGEINKAFGVQE